MREAFPQLTLFLGPPTNLARVFNRLIRVYRHALPEAGLRVYPNRMAMPIVGHCQDTARSVADRQEILAKAAGGLPMILSATSFLGGGRDMFSGLRLFPGAGNRFSAFQSIAPNARLIMTMAPVHHLFSALESELMNNQVESAGWEQVFELSWIDMVRDARESLPESELVLLTDGASTRSEQVLTEILGEAASALPNSLGLLRPSLNETGQAVLARMEAEGEVDQARQLELFENFQMKLEPSVFQEKFGFDKVTDALLCQRFEEDLLEIGKMPGVRVL